MGETLLIKLLAWLFEWQQLSVFLVVVLVIASALGVVYSAHLTRQQYAGIQELERESDFLDSEYERLLLEQSAWADYSRVDQLSREELDMISPKPADTIVVTR